MFGECCLICMWFTLNNLFGKVLVHPLLLAICLFVHKVEKQDHFIRQKHGNCEYLWDTISNCFKKILIHPPLGVIHRWDSCSSFIASTFHSSTPGPCQACWVLFSHPIIKIFNNTTTTRRSVPQVIANKN